MKWIITKRYFCSGLGTPTMDPDSEFRVGRKIGPKSLWDELWRKVDKNWEVHKGDGEYVFENYHVDSNGNSWGKSEVVLTYLNYYTIYDYLNTWLDKGKLFDMEWDNDEFSEWIEFDEEKNYIEDFQADGVKGIVEDYIAYNFPEEIIDIVIQGVPVEVDGELFCNNPYAHPEYSLDWNINEKEFVILVQSPSYVGNGYIPFEDQLTITMKEVRTWNT